MIMGTKDWMIMSIKNESETDIKVKFASETPLSYARLTAQRCYMLGGFDFHIAVGWPTVEYRRRSLGIVRDLHVHESISCQT